MLGVVVGQQAAQEPTNKSKSKARSKRAPGGERESLAFLFFRLRAAPFYFLGFM